MAIRAGFDPALAWHMGKIMECGALCAEPVGRNVMGWLRRDHFEIEPLNPAERCTRRRSPPTHSTKRPIRSCWPDPAARSTCRTASTSRSPTDGCASRAAASSPAKHYTVKLEGARRTSGYRSIFIAGARDPIFISPDRRDPRPGDGRHARLFRRSAGGELPHHPASLRQERRDGRPRAGQDAGARALHHRRGRRRDAGRSPRRSAARPAPA